MNNTEISNLFQNTNVNIINNTNLRKPQIDGWNAARQHFSTSNDKAIIQIPVGCGKTGLMALLPFKIAQGRILIIAPNLEIKNTIKEAFDVSGSNFFLKNTNVINSVSSVPFAATLDSTKANLIDCDNSHIVITNIQQISTNNDRWMSQFPNDFFDMILVDEGHHNVASSWERVFNHFPKAKIISLTATPFRSDGKEISGKIIYKYPIIQAMVNGYIKQLSVVKVYPEIISFTYNGESKTHSLDEVLKLKDEDWFNRGVALSEKCNSSIVEASISVLHKLRETDTRHQIIAVACSIRHAHQITALYEQRGLKVKAISSKMPQNEINNVIQELKTFQIDCIVQVKMLGEGFDHPFLSVAAIFQPFKSLSPYVQFIGRIMRVIKQNEPDDPNNNGYIISHVGLNIDRHWDDFKCLDDLDQKLVKQIIGTDRDYSIESSSDINLKIERMIVNDETISHYTQDNFIQLSAEATIDEIESQLLNLGVDLDEFGLSKEDLLSRYQRINCQGNLTIDDIPISPQNKRLAAKKELNQLEKSLVPTIISHFNTSIKGNDLTILFPEEQTSNNFALIIKLIHRKINHILGIESNMRNNVSVEQLNFAKSKLDEVLNFVISIIESKLSHKS